MIDACRTVNLPMTRAKMAIFVIAEAFESDGTPLILIRHADPTITSLPQPERRIDPVINDNGSADLRVRAMFRRWSANVTLEFDADMITLDSVINLLDRAGRQVGIGEGRPFSKNSVGQGWGTFQVEANHER